MADRKCKYCKGPVFGRSDKIFCTTTCKSRYHRQLRRITWKATRKIDKILHRNRSILFEIMGEEIAKKEIDKYILDKKNFRFDYITGYYENARGKRYHIVYDFAWMQFSKGKILIIRIK